ncbi:MAG: TlyA family RNA methyltransferase [Rhizobiaceae bacterium]
MPDRDKPENLRLDELLVLRGLFVSRSRARDAIMRGTVRVDGVEAAKPGIAVSEAAAIEVDDPARGFVARSALKLLAGLDQFGFDPDGRSVLDMGASTGGFTQVLLQRGARCVFAVDVGHGQLHSGLASDQRVIVLEGLNARDLVASHLDGIAPEAIVADMSFISLKLALPPALCLAAPGAWAALLVKPQFEAGREAIGKGGLLRRPEEGPRVAADLREWLDIQPGWRAIDLVPSPIHGGDGNREFLLGGVKDR